MHQTAFFLHKILNSNTDNLSNLDLGFPLSLSQPSRPGALLQRGFLQFKLEKALTVLIIHNCGTRTAMQKKSTTYFQSLVIHI